MRSILGQIKDAVEQFREVPKMETLNRVKEAVDHLRGIRKRPELSSLPLWALKAYKKTQIKAQQLAGFPHAFLYGDSWAALRLLGFRNFRYIKHEPDYSRPTTIPSTGGPGSIPAYIVHSEGFKNPTRNTFRLTKNTAAPIEDGSAHTADEWELKVKAAPEYEVDPQLKDIWRGSSTPNLFGTLQGPPSKKVTDPDKAIAAEAEVTSQVTSKALEDLQGSTDPKKIAEAVKKAAEDLQVEEALKGLWAPKDPDKP
jgi:hypothetical protein